MSTVFVHPAINSDTNALMELEAKTGRFVHFIKSGKKAPTAVLNNQVPPHCTPTPPTPPTPPTAA